MPRKRYKVTIYTTINGDEKGAHKKDDPAAEKTIQLVCDDCGRTITGMWVTEAEYMRLMETNSYLRCARKSCDP